MSQTFSLHMVMCYCSPFLSFSLGVLEGDFNAFGMPAQESCRYYDAKSTPSDLVQVFDPWSRVHFFHSTKKLNVERVGKISVSVSPLFEAQPSSAQKMSEHKLHYFLSPEGIINWPQCREFLLLSSVSNRIELLSSVAEEITMNSTSRQGVQIICQIICEILLPILQDVEICDEFMEMILLVLLEEKCCQPCLLYYVENWLQKDAFADLIANSENPEFRQRLSSDILDGDKWPTFFLVCWCVKVLGTQNMGVISSYDMTILGVNLVQSVLRYGLTVFSEWSPSLEMDPVLFALEILRPVSILLPIVVGFDHSFVPSCSTIFLQFVNSVGRYIGQSPLQDRFLESVLRILLKIENSPTQFTDIRDHLHPKCKTNRRNETIGLSHQVKGLSREFSFWNHSSLDSDNFTSFVIMTTRHFSSLSSHSKYLGIKFLVSFLSSLIRRLRSIQFETDAPPKIRKRASVGSTSHSDNIRYRSVISTTLQGIIERGETLPHLNPFDILLSFFGSHSTPILSLLQFSEEILSSSGVRQSYENQFSNCSPTRRLVGSTITRRLLGQASMKQKNITVESKVVALDESVLRDLFLTLRQLLDSFDFFLVGDGRNPTSIKDSYTAACSSVCLGIRANLFEGEKCEQKYAKTALNRETSRIHSIYQSLKIYLYLILVCHHSCDMLSGDCSSFCADWVIWDIPRLIASIEVLKIMSTSDPFLLMKDYASQNLWSEVWLGILKTLIALMESCSKLLTVAPSKGLEDYFFELSNLLETHCSYRDLEEISTTYPHSKSSAKMTAVDALLHSVEKSCRQSTSFHRRPTGGTQNIEYYRLIRDQILGDHNMNKPSNSKSETSTFPYLFRLALFRSCIHISSLAFDTDTPSSDNHIASVANVIIDRIDVWLLGIIPQKVATLPPIYPESCNASVLTFGHVSEILNCLKLSLQPNIHDLSSQNSSFFIALSELRTRTNHSLCRWRTYVSTFMDMHLSCDSMRPGNPEVFRCWTISVRLAAIYSFLDRVFVKTADLNTFLRFFGSPAGKSLRETISVPVHPWFHSNSEGVSKSMLTLLGHRGERFSMISSTTLDTSLPLSADELLDYSLQNGVISEHHHQEIRDLLKSLLESGYWELGVRLAQSYIAEYMKILQAIEERKNQNVVNRITLPPSLSKCAFSSF